MIATVVEALHPLLIWERVVRVVFVHKQHSLIVMVILKVLVFLAQIQTHAPLVNSEHVV
jgi:hypothetical protein